MTTKRKAPTTDYFSLYNTDWQQGGKYSGLTDTAVSVLVRLMSYSDGDGWIRRKDGNGCSMTEISGITGVPYKRLRVVILELQRADIIVVHPNNAIHILSFFHDNTRRKRNRDNRSLTDANQGTPVGRKV